jgi:hypothetical protein
MNDVSENYFGYISQEEKRFDRWDEALLFIIKEILEDAASKNVLFTRSYDEIMAMYEQHRKLFRAVKTPALLHKDIGPNNFFVDPQSYSVTDIIDCERTIYGDRLLEPVCAFLLDDTAFMHSYYNSEHLFDHDEHIRIALYSVYICLTMATECVFRGYDDGSRSWRQAELNKAFLNYDTVTAL